MFTLGRAAIYPAGSWEIALFNEQAQFELGAFPPPVARAVAEDPELDREEMQRRQEQAV